MGSAIEKLKRNSEVVYEANKNCEKRKKMVVISHCLSCGGAPLVLLELLELFMDDYDITLISLRDGELNRTFVEKGIDVLVGTIEDYAVEGNKVWQEFDLAILNTILTYSFLPCFQNTSVPTLWWLHEPDAMFKMTYEICIPFGLLSNNIKILSVTDYTASCVNKYHHIYSQVMHMGIKDCYQGELVRGDNIVRFFMPATYENRKGQDVLVKAILELPSEYMNQMEFYFAGPIAETDYYDLVGKMAQIYPNIVMLGILTKEGVYEVYQQIDCVVAPSRADPTPTTIVEGMMFNKLVLCSDATGISKHLEDNVSGYVFPTEDYLALRNKLIYICDTRAEWNRIKENGRKVYLDQFERSKMEKQIHALVER